MRRIKRKEEVWKGYGRHRVDRVSRFLFSRPNWVRPLPHPQASVSPLWFGGGGVHSLAGEGVGGPKSDERTDTVEGRFVEGLHSGSADDGWGGGGGREPNAKKGKLQLSFIAIIFMQHSECISRFFCDCKKDTSTIASTE
jgi:hypothetical protein